MDSNKQKLAIALSIKHARTVFFVGLLLFLHESSAHAQYDPRGPFYKDPQQLNLTPQQRAAQGVAELERQQVRIAIENQRCMAEANQELALAIQRAAAPVAPIDPRFDTNEVKLCELLWEKVSQPNYDIAEINLLAAQGLPGSENLDVEKSIKTLDRWSAWVKHETDRQLYRFQKEPAKYSNSEAYFRMLIMVCTLQEDFKVCYNKDPKLRAGPKESLPDNFSFFANSQDLFVHGLTGGAHQGTCASLPVLYVAIGRRLGYPLKLVECKEHLFVRWEDTRERFNIEGTNRGLNCYPDSEYMEWPWPISKEEMETGMYMKSLSPKRELAGFMESRALCLRQHKQNKQQLTVKRFADDLRRKEGVNVDKLNQLVRESQRKSGMEDVVGAGFLFQRLTNTNSWRTPGNERGAPGQHTVFAIDRFDSK